jgi:hypothetical protein
MRSVKVGLLFICAGGCNGTPTVTAGAIDPNVAMNMPAISCAPGNAPLGFRINNGILMGSLLTAGQMPGQGMTTGNFQNNMSAVNGSNPMGGQFGSVQMIQAGGGNRMRTQTAPGSVPTFTMSLDYFGDTGVNGQPQTTGLNGMPLINNGGVNSGLNGIQTMNPMGGQIVDGIGTLTLSAGTQAQLQGLMASQQTFGQYNQPFMQPGMQSGFGQNFNNQQNFNGMSTVCVSSMAFQAQITSGTVINRIELFLYLNNGQRTYYGVY